MGRPPRARARAAHGRARIGCSSAVAAGSGSALQRCRCLVMRDTEAGPCYRPAQSVATLLRARSQAAAAAGGGSSHPGSGASHAGSGVHTLLTIAREECGSDRGLGGQRPHRHSAAAAAGPAGLQAAQHGGCNCPAHPDYAACRQPAVKPLARARVDRAWGSREGWVGHRTSEGQCADAAVGRSGRLAFGFASRRAQKPGWQGCPFCPYAVPIAPGQPILGPCAPHNCV